MKIYLTQEQWRSLWTYSRDVWEEIDDNDLQSELENRIKLFNKLYSNSLSYNELPADLLFELSEGYWGVVEGNEKDITLFLLSL